MFQNYALGLVTLTWTKSLKINIYHQNHAPLVWSHWHKPSGLNSYVSKSCSWFGHIDINQVDQNQIMPLWFGHIDTNQVALNAHISKTRLLVWSHRHEPSCSKYIYARNHILGLVILTWTKLLKYTCHQIMLSVWSHWYGPSCSKLMIPFGLVILTQTKWSKFID